jgi:phage baseplate assembly protein V
MGISRDTLDQLRHVLRPLATRVANTVARGVIQFVDDGKKQQLVQIGVLAGETVDSAEHFHPYGLSSVPEAGAEAVVLFPNGDRSHPLVVAVSDRRCRPTGGKSGDVVVYNKRGAKIVLRADSGDIEIQPGAGGQVLIRDEGGNAEPLVRKSDFDGHTHPPGTLAAPNGPVTGVTGGAPAAAGSQRLRAQ